MTEALIYDCLRTPRGKGKADGSLHEVRPVDLLKPLYCALPQRTGIDPGLVEDIVLGCVTPVGEQGADIARVAALYAGWPEHVPGVTLNRFCASGLEAVNTAAAKVASGIADWTVGGGIESMSRVPMGSDGGAMIMDPLVNEGLGFIPQGVSADLIATLEGFSREELDAFAVASQQKAAAAQADGRFDKSLVPIRDLNGLPILERDETVRGDTSVQVLAGLKPSFQVMGQMGFDTIAAAKYPQLSQIRHVHHAGNSSGIVDGAALVLLGSREAGQRAGIAPRARIRAMTVVGSEPTIMLTGPTPAMRKALQKASMSIADIDLFEINEAFAAVVLKAMRDLDIDPAKVNVNGGAIALGHPLGATGAMLLGTLLDELERRDLNTGLVTLCVGAGMGIATIIERL